MDYLTKESIVRRVSYGKLYTELEYNGVLYDVVFSDPRGDLLLKADYIYKKALEDYKGDEVFFTLDESYNILKQKGLWSNKLETEMQSLQDDIKDLAKKLKKSKFYKEQIKIINNAIDRAKKRKDELNIIKNQLWTSTSDYMADVQKKRFIVKNITNIECDPSLFETPSFLDSLAVCYYRDNAISEATIREMARSNPWRLYYTASKQTGTSLFPYSAIEMTELQTILLLWSKVYDFGFESMNRPSDDVIENDELFDIWYAEQLEESKKDSGSNKGIINSGQETFVPCDREGASEVYDLNDPVSRNTIKKRDKYIDKHGIVEFSKVPDVVENLRMEANKLSLK